MVSYEQIHEAIEARLGVEAVGHCQRVGDTAAALALIYGVDVDQARMSGLLHDWDRERDHAELVAAARSAGLDVTGADEQRPYLLHAKTGARGVEEAFPEIDPAVVRAIELHTMGAEEMTPLDKVVWLADMIEPHRRFAGVDALRECVGTVSLDDLFASGYAHSLSHLIDRRKVIHPTTVAVYNAHVVRDRS